MSDTERAVLLLDDVYQSMDALLTKEKNFIDKSWDEDVVWLEAWRDDIKAAMVLLAGSY